eukprot:2210062-Rhodomonas_salina.2
MRTTRRRKLRRGAVRAARDDAKSADVSRSSVAQHSGLTRCNSAGRCTAGRTVSSSRHRVCPSVAGSPCRQASPSRVSASHRDVKGQGRKKKKLARV